MDVSKCDIFISVGVPDGIEFEEEFMNKNPKLCGVILDGTQQIISKSKKLTHFKQNISPTKTLRTENLHAFFKNFKNIYLKMNVKGYENEYFNSLTPEQISRINVLHIQTHQDDNLTVLKTFQSSHTISKNEPLEKYGKNSKNEWRVVNYIFIKKT
jgi:hypothetical protein